MAIDYNGAIPAGSPFVVNGETYAIAVIPDVNDSTLPNQVLIAEVFNNSLNLSNSTYLPRLNRHKDDPELFINEAISVFNGWLSEQDTGDDMSYIEKVIEAFANIQIVDGQIKRA